MTTSKRLIIILFVLVAVSLAYFFITRNTPSPGEETTMIPSDVQNQGATVPPIAQMTTEHLETEYAVVDMSYPVPRSSVKEYTEIFEFINEARADFESSFDDAQVKKWITDRGEKYNFTLNTTVATSSKTVTYILELYKETGGAHGGTIVRTFTYDANKKLVTLDDIFDGAYLEKISVLARTYLSKKLGEDTVPQMLAEGTAPTPDNYSAWILSDDSITFIFQQYQVGPYVIGLK
jgi:hypothetical protein